MLFERFKIPALQLFDYFASPQVLAFSISLGVLGQVIAKYVFSDWEFAVFLLVAMIVDTVVGLVKAWRDKVISRAGYTQVLIKTIIYFSILVISHVLTHFLVHGENNGLFGWIDNVFYVALILREAISIIRNVAIIYPGLIPQALLKRLEDFDEKGNPE